MFSDKITNYTFCSTFKYWKIYFQLASDPKNNDLLCKQCNLTPYFLILNQLQIFRKI